MININKEIKEPIDKINSIVSDLKAEIIELGEEHLNVPCPFRNYGKLDCVYLNGIRCEDIEICPANSDSFCGDLIQKNFV